MTRFRRLTALAVGAALTVALTANTAQAAVPKMRPATASKGGSHPTSTPPPTNYSYYRTESAGETHVVNRYVGPSAATYYGRGTIKGFVSSGGKRKPTVAFTQYPSPLVIQSGAGLDAVTPGKARLYPLTWYQPWTWDWPKILGTSWDYVYNGCLHGALMGAMGAIGTQAAVGWLVRGAEMYLGPEAVVAVAIGGCWADLTSGP